jgi:hypothetical protein
MFVVMFSPAATGWLKSPETALDLDAPLRRPISLAQHTEARPVARPRPRRVNK